MRNDVEKVRAGNPRRRTRSCSGQVGKKKVHPPQPRKGKKRTSFFCYEKEQNKVGCPGGEPAASITDDYCNETMDEENIVRFL